MGYLLLTNDDGIDSPSLIPFIEALSTLAPIKTIVPTQERSWISKAITRFGNIRIERIKQNGLEIHTVEGSPADCVQIGIHSLFDRPPEMIISGINLGLNHGLAFFTSSGTIGAAIEGAIAGIPSVAFSTGDLKNHNTWGPYAWSASREELWNRAAELSVDLLSSVRDVEFPQKANILSVNFPHNADIATPRVITRLATTDYKNLFHQSQPGLFTHKFSGELHAREDIKGTDLETLTNGSVSVTPIRLAHAVETELSFCNAIERKPTKRTST